MNNKPWRPNNKPVINHEPISMRGYILLSPLSHSNLEIVNPNEQTQD